MAMQIDPLSPRVHLKTLGCKVNRVESDRFVAELLSLGASIAELDDSSVVVINTCTVTGEADSKARKAVRQALQGAARPVVVVTGCLAALDAEGLLSIDDRVVVETDKARVVERIGDLLGFAVDGLEGASLPPAFGSEFRTRGSIKVEDGCDNRCTYCIVPNARGGPRATPLKRIVAEAQNLVAAGVAEIVLTGINIGRYRDEGADLAGVVEAVAGTGVRRIRLSSVEPPDLTPKLLDVLARTPAVCEHLHVPLQSGSDGVLAAMGRHYDAARFLELIASARSALPGLAVTTDVIAGFPGETDADHIATIDVVRSAGFSKLHVFRYSVRQGTPAASMGQVDPAVRSARAAQLRAVGTELRDAYLRARTGTRAQVLVERIEHGIARGTTRDYVRVTFPVGPEVTVGAIADVQLDGASCE